MINVDEFINLMKEADLSKLSYHKIKSIIMNNEILFPYTTSMIKKGTPIERGRLNENNAFYNSEFEISYRTDTGNIHKFGRANEPYRSKFYGAFPSKKIQLSRIVLFSELDKNFKKTPEYNYESTMTIGRWIVKEDFEVADVCFSDNYLTNNEIKSKYENWLTKIEDTEIGQEKYMNLLKYFSDEFSKNSINSHHDYKTSSIYTDYAISLGLNGIMYPSVKTNFEGFNIALTPKTVERYLELKQVCMFKYKVENGKAKLYPTHYCDELGSLNSKFNWKAVEPEK